MQRMLEKKYWSYNLHYTTVDLERPLFGTDGWSLKVMDRWLVAKCVYSDGLWVAKKMSVAKAFSDGTYSDHPYGSLKAVLATNCRSL
jgi:hypothetical protein